MGINRIPRFPVRHSTLVIAVALIVASAVAMAVFAAKSVKLKFAGDAPKDSVPKIALAYVESNRKGLPDPDMFTHLVYASAEFNNDCDGLEKFPLEKLNGMVELKSRNPELKVILCIAGSKRRGYSEMTGDKKKRKAFVREVKNLIDSLNLDGVDLDWEFPTTEAGGHTASPDDARNYVALVRDLRKALGKKKWISYYSNNSGAFIDQKGMVPYVNYVHVSGYNLSIPKDGERSYHQSPLYPSAKTGGWCVKSAVERHIELGVPAEKILMGIPFFGRGKSPFPSYLDCNQFAKYSDHLRIIWDDDSKAPYYADKDGNLVMGFDDERSIKEKFDFIRANNIPGVFVWNYDSDFDDHRLGKAIERLRK